MLKSPNSIGPLLLSIGSGSAALIYEIVWFQLLELVIGSSAVSLGVLLATFMGGTCLGSLILPRLVSTRHHPLRVYAMIEAGIGLLGILVLLVMPLAGGVYTAWSGYGLRGFLLRGVVAAACLLPPTLLMGATFPALARRIEATPNGVSWLGFFYGGNIAGAVLGCLLSGFYLLREYDLATATYVAAAVNAAVAGIALALASASRHRGEARARQADAVGSWEIPRSRFPDSDGLRGHRVVRALRVRGRIDLDAHAWTVVWRLRLHAVHHSRGLSRWSWDRQQHRVVALLEVSRAHVWRWDGASCSAPARSPGRLTVWPHRSRIGPSIRRSHLTSGSTFSSTSTGRSGPCCRRRSCGVRAFPLALAAIGPTGQDAARLVARVYAANTLGAIAGAFGASLLLIAWVGSQRAEQLLIVLSIVFRSAASVARGPH